MADNVVFLEPGDERAQKIAKAMGSQTANDILQILGEGPRSLTDITGRLNIPMNTAKYHVENLLDAGLIAVEKTKYSIKGREVKIYTLTNQLLVVAPRQSDARSLLLKYASLFGIVAFGSFVIAAMAPVIGPGSMLRGSANTLNMAPEYALLQETDAAGVGTAKAVAETVAQNMTRGPEVLASGTKGIADAWAAGNATPSAIHTAAATVPPAPVSTLAAPPTMAPPPQVITQAAFDEGFGAGSAVFPSLDPALAFFLGGVLVIFVLLCYEAWLWKKQRK